MSRIMMLFFVALTLGAMLLTYYNVGLEETKYNYNVGLEETKYSEDPSVRSGSAGMTSAGGYRYGK